MKLDPPPNKRPRTLLESLVIDGAIVGGMGLVSYGAWAVFAPAGFIVGGILLLAIGVAGALR